MVERLYVFPKLIDLNVINNPAENACTSFNIFVAEILAKRPSMKRICKHDVTEANLLEAVYLQQYKHEKALAEAARQKALEEAAAA